MVFRCPPHNMFQISSCALTKSGQVCMYVCTHTEKNQTWFTKNKNEFSKLFTKNKNEFSKLFTKFSKLFTKNKNEFSKLFTKNQKSIY